MQLTLEVLVRRGDILESRHRLEAAVCDADGRLVAGTEEPGRVTTLRSAAKPFQLVLLVERGHAARWNLTDEDLAVMASSHTGSLAHRERVAAILATVGASEADLVCGYHDPLDAEALAEIRLHPELRSRLYNNCSGNHAGLIALARGEGWPVTGYGGAEHPVQVALRRVLAEICGPGADEPATAMDDCGIVVFAAPLTAIARAYARLALAMEQGEARERALHRIRRAMTSHPDLNGGAGRLGTRLMEVTRGRLVAKGGAEGLECVGIPGAGLGIALKCLDGAIRPVAPAMLALLEHLDLLTDAECARLAETRHPALRDSNGAPVGHLETVVEVMSRSS